MMYHGKLYGKLWNKYFDTDHTTDEWDAMEKRIKELEAENLALNKANGVETSHETALHKHIVSKRSELLISVERELLKRIHGNGLGISSFMTWIKGNL